MEPGCQQKRTGVYAEQGLGLIVVQIVVGVGWTQVQAGWAGGRAESLVATGRAYCEAVLPMSGILTKMNRGLF
ncbi:hypothetical protein NBRC116587_01460 [Pseudoteredinibacter isoporae]